MRGNEAEEDEDEGEKVAREMMIASGTGGEAQQQQQQQQQLGGQGGMEGERLTLTSSMSYRPLEEDPEWGLFLPFDSLEFSFVGGAIGVCRLIPEEVSSLFFFFFFFFWVGGRMGVVGEGGNEVHGFVFAV